jgi:Tol biopolymer transport system component
MRHSIAIAAVALLAAFPAAAHATWPGEPGQIAYLGVDIDDEGTDDGLYTIGPDGSRDHRLFRRATGDVAWSRDGKRLAFLRTERQLWQAGADGSGARLVVRVSGEGALDPAWSPSGRKIVFTRFRGEDDAAEVWIVRRNGKGLRRLVEGHDATWSSKGLVAYATESGDVATIRPNGRGGRIWVPQGSPVVVNELDFSPDGSRLVYQQNSPRLGRPTVRTINLRTGTQTSFRDQTKRVFAQDIAWAPSNRRLAYVHLRRSDDTTQLRTVRRNGTDVETVFGFPDGVTPFGFAWQTG